MVAITINLCLSFIMLLMPLYFIYWPAKEMNNWKGYRTERSQRSRETWDFAQRYWPRILMKLTVGVIAIQLLLIGLIDRDVTILITVFLWVLVLLTSIFLTEEKLSDTFGKQL